MQNSLAKFKSCKICGKKQIGKEQIFLTDDGYCSVCNHKFRDRARIKPFFQFEYDKSTEYKHLNTQGRKLNKDNIKCHEIRSKNSAMASVAIYQKYLRNKNKKMDEWLEGA